MLPVDLLHEFELGVWKAIFIHLIWILMAHGKGSIQALNHRYGCSNYCFKATIDACGVRHLDRYRQVPTFGRATVHRFSANASAMKQLAARDFEDLLQVRRISNCIQCSLFTMYISAQFQCSKCSCPSHTIK